MTLMSSFRSGPLDVTIVPRIWPVAFALAGLLLLLVGLIGLLHCGPQTLGRAETPVSSRGEFSPAAAIQPVSGFSPAGARGKLV